MKLLIITFGLTLSVALGAEKGCVQCPLQDGIHPHPTRHDAYVVCMRGEASFTVCPEGQIYLKQQGKCGLQMTKNALKPSPLASIELRSCPITEFAKKNLQLSSSTTTFGPCGQDCTAYSGLTSGSDVHSVCRAETQTCPQAVLGRGLDSNYAEEITASHNNLRDQLAGGTASGALVGTLPSGSNIQELSWNGELAKVAQAWCDTCQQAHDCNNCRKITSRNYAVGQNAYFLFTTSIATPKADSVVNAWWDEINDLTSLDLLTNFGVTNPTIGHFTQVAWANTYEIGCGWTVQAPETTGWNTHYVFCNYGSAGNYLTQPVYEFGAPASNCGSGTSSTYPNLCAPPAGLADPCEG